jgi:hypothetical protein
MAEIGQDPSMAGEDPVSRNITSHEKQFTKAIHPHSQFIRDNNFFYQ